MQILLLTIFKEIDEVLLISRPMYLIAGIVNTLISDPRSTKIFLNIKPLHPTSIIGSYSCWTVIVSRDWKMDGTLCAYRSYFNYLRTEEIKVTSCPIVMSVFLTLMSFKIEYEPSFFYIGKSWNSSRLRRDFFDFLSIVISSSVSYLLVEILLTLVLPPLHRWLTSLRKDCLKFAIALSRVSS